MKPIFVILLFSIIIYHSHAQPIETVKLPDPQKTGGMPLMEALQNRQSQRSYSDKDLTLQELSNLLWAAYGINRPGGKRTVPSARGWTEFDIYIVKADGWHLYQPVGHALQKLGNEDIREHTGTQDFVKTAPLNLIYVADYEKMTDAGDDARDFYSATDVGFIAQNVYLYCASAGLATVVRGSIDKGKAEEVLKLHPNQHVILAQTVGYPGD